MEESIKFENYRKFIQIAEELKSPEPANEHELRETTWEFNLQALARVVDIAYCEGQIAQLTSDPSYAESVEKINMLGALQTQIENSLPEGFVEIEP